MSQEPRLTVFLCGDVMTGRGIDQVFPLSCPPRLYEPHITSALEYIALAERMNGPVPREVNSTYVWGDALAALDRVRPDARVINLETSITTSEAALLKGINYRMHPENVNVLTAAGVDCCVLANNHVLDWGEAGLLDTLETLAGAGVSMAGAGWDLTAARAPAVIPAGAGRRVLVFAAGFTDSGIPRDWAANDRKPGVHLLPDFSDRSVESIAERVLEIKKPDDIAIASLHWGGNWGYDVPPSHRYFAHALIDHAKIDIVHGHSSHHPKGIEVYHDRLVLYGCGDFLNDYEGIQGMEHFRGDLALMYFPTVEVPGGRLLRLEMTPLRIRNFRLHAAEPADRQWLRTTLDREAGAFGSHVVARGDGLELGGPWNREYESPGES